MSETNPPEQASPRASVEPTESAESVEPSREAVPGFYVGYRAMPRAHFLALLAIAPLLIAAVFGGAWVLGKAQPPAGSGFWDRDVLQRHTGTIRMAPYPLLVKYEGGSANSYHLVNAGKHGAVGRVRELDGQVAAVRGTLLQRDGQRMIVLGDNPGDLRGMAEALATDAEHAQRSLGPRTLHGEIVDIKCYLGAMKPGRGKAHRPCAMLCIMGGIPPVLIVPNDAGLHTHYLLTGPDGDRISGEQLDALLPRVGLPVRVTGEVTRRDGMLRVAVDPARDIAFLDE